MKSRFHLIVRVVPVVLMAAALKIGFHYLQWEIIPKELTGFFPSILTGIIFILGFLLAGVVSDYKESEKIPNEMAASLFAILQEAEYIQHTQGLSSAKDLIELIKSFVPTLKQDFFLKGNKNLEILIDQMSVAIIQIGKDGAVPNFVFRMKTELTNIKKLVNRITVIKTTDFIPSVFVCIEFVSSIFLLVYCLLSVEPWWGGVILVSIFTFVIYSILFLIKDMEDPFEYDGTEQMKADEVSLDILNQFHTGLINRSRQNNIL